MRLGCRARTDFSTILRVSPRVPWAPCTVKTRLKRGLRDQLERVLAAWILSAATIRSSQSNGRQSPIEQEELINRWPTSNPGWPLFPPGSAGCANDESSPGNAT